MTTPLTFELLLLACLVREHRIFEALVWGGIASGTLILGIIGEIRLRR